MSRSRVTGSSPGYGAIDASCSSASVWLCSRAWSSAYSKHSRSLARASTTCPTPTYAWNRSGRSSAAWVAMMVPQLWPIRISFSTPYRSRTCSASSIASATYYAIVSVSAMDSGSIVRRVRPAPRWS